MQDERSPEPATSTRTLFWRVTLALFPLLWCFGLISSLLMGCILSQALLKATAYALSGLAGWIVYLLIMRPSRSSFGVFFAGINIQAVANVAMLNPTRSPWPFPQMLAHGL